MKKLKLNRQTVRVLTGRYLAIPVGGVITGDDSDTCGTGRCSGRACSDAPWQCGSIFNTACETVCLGPCVSRLPPSC